MDTSDALIPRRRGRPRRDRGPYEDTRNTLVWTGVAILTEKGFSAVGLDEILRAARVPKGSFYHYFDSKDEFGAVLIDAYADYFSRILDQHFLDEAHSPLQRLDNFMEYAKAGMARFEFRRGCLVGNLGQEMGVLPERFRDQIRRVFLDWQARAARCFLAAQEAGEIRREHDCRHLAEFFFTSWEGAVLRAKLERNSAPLETFAKIFLLVLRS